MATGVAASQMEQRGVATERSNLNREIAVTNPEIRQLRARITKLKSWLAEAAANTERRAKTLDEHISQSDIYLKHKALHEQYRQIPNPKKREAFYEAHRADLIPYEAARDYLQKIMNGKTGLSTKAWRDERGKLAAERKQLCTEYNALKEETREVEQIRRGVEGIMRSEVREQ